jgi:alpha-1,2-mannosyltransferase
MLWTFRVDMFEYPPPFLLLPRALTGVVPEFLRLRMVWFALEGGVLLLAFLVVARMLGREAGARAFLLSPLIWAALPTATTLQFGNAQPLIVALALVAMVLFERRHHAIGGLLLAFVTLSKLFPGVLIAYLLARRQWRPLAWTLAFGIVLVLATVHVIGAQSFAAFREHLPRLLSGESFPGLRRPAGIAINDSLPGLVFKLNVLGVPGLSFPAARVVGWMATFLAVGVAIAIGRRSLQDREKPVAWLAILLVATLRSPFLPQDYAVFPPLWLLTLMAAGGVTATGVGPGPRALVGFVLAWLGLNILVPVDATLEPGARMAISAVPQAIVLAMTVMACRVKTRAQARGRAHELK